MGLFDKLFVQEELSESAKGGARESLKAQQSMPNHEEEVSVSGDAADDILKNALAPLEGKAVTIYTLRDLTATMPTGVKKDSILGVLKVTKISESEIKQDADARISILEATERKLQERIASDISVLESEIKECQDRIEINRKNKENAEALLREFQMAKAKMTDEIKSILSTIE